MFVCDWNPRPHRFCGGPGMKEVQCETCGGVRVVGNGNAMFPEPCPDCSEVERLRAELERERHDAWETLGAVNVKDLQADRDRWRALCEMVDVHYGASLDHQPGYVRAIRAALEKGQ